MRKLLMISLALSSFSLFAQNTMDSNCEANVLNEVLTSPSVKTKIQYLLTDLSRLDQNGNIIVNTEIKEEIEALQSQANELARLVCR